MLNLKRLQYLDAVYQYKNFTQASEALYVSQPAISSAVQALEEELGRTIHTSPLTQYNGALGAALFAYDRYKRAHKD